MTNFVNEKKLVYSKEKGIPFTVSGVNIPERSSWAPHQPVVDYKKCIECQWCWIFCPDTAIERNGLKPIIDRSECKGCSLCAAVCPVKAIEMKKAKEIALNDPSTKPIKPIKVLKGKK